MTIRGTIRKLALALAACTAFVAGPAAADALRVCADPDNLPFSKAEGPERGLYVELAELVGRKLDRAIQYTWWLTYNQRRALRNTIMKDDCDAVFALPAFLILRKRLRSARLRMRRYCASRSRISRRSPRPS